MVLIILISLIVVLFYLLFPGGGAFYVRKKWKEFRKTLLKISFYPVLDYHGFRKVINEDLPVFYRFFGRIEAIQNDNEIWLRNGNFTVSADLRDVKIYIIPGFVSSENNAENYENNSEIILDEMPQVISWSRIFSLTENSEMMIAGPLFRESGKGIFRQTESETLTVLLFDGTKESLLKRAVWSGRHRNEFWNSITPVSVITGAFALFTATYVMFSGASLKYFKIFSICLSLLPIMPLFPPGVVLFFIYRKKWKEARFIRGERDVIKIPLRFFSENDLLYDEKCCVISEEVEYCFRKLTGPEEAEQLCRDKKLKIRSSSADRCSGDIYYYFWNNQGKKDPTSYDPMLENVIICNNPYRTVEKCNAAARKNEFLSLFAFAAGLIINFTFTFYILTLIR